MFCILHGNYFILFYLEYACLFIYYMRIKIVFFLILIILARHAAAASAMSQQDLDQHNELRRAAASAMSQQDIAQRREIDRGDFKTY